MSQPLQNATKASSSRENTERVERTCTDLGAMDAAYNEKAGTGVAILD